MIKERLESIAKSLQRSLDHENSNKYPKSCRDEDGKPNVHYMYGYYEQTIRSALGDIQSLHDSRLLNPKKEE